MAGLTLFSPLGKALNAADAYLSKLNFTQPYNPYTTGTFELNVYNLPQYWTGNIHITITQNNKQVKFISKTITNPNNTSPLKTTITWDGKDNNGKTAMDGNYVATASGSLEDGNQKYNFSPTSTFNFQIKTVYPTLSVPQMIGVSPYDPLTANKNLAFYSNLLNGFNVDITGYIEKKGDSQKLIEWKHINQNSTQHFNQVFEWDAKINGKTVMPGNYIFGIYGNQGELKIASQTKEFAINYDVSNLPPENPNIKQCAGYLDVLETHTDCKYIEWAKNHNIMLGYENGTFGPNDYYNRAQNVVANLRAKKIFNPEGNYCNGLNPFPDVTETGIPWAFQSICQAKNMKVVEGYKADPYLGLFVPGKNVSYEEAVAMSIRILIPANEIPGIYNTSYTGVPSGQWFSGYAKYAYDNNLFPDGFNLGKPLTRVQVAKLFYQFGQIGKIQ